MHHPKHHRAGRTGNEGRQFPQQAQPQGTEDVPPHTLGTKDRRPAQYRGDQHRNEESIGRWG